MLLVGNIKGVWKTIANGSFVKPLKTSISFVAWKLLHHKAKLHPLQMETFYIIIVKCLRLDNPRSLIKRRQAKTYPNVLKPSEKILSIYNYICNEGFPYLDNDAIMCVDGCL